MIKAVWKNETENTKPAMVTNIHSPESDTEMMNFVFSAFSRLLMIFQCDQCYSTPPVPEVPKNLFIFSPNREAPESFQGGADTPQILLLSFLPRVCFTTILISTSAAHARKQLSANVVKGKTLRGK